MSNTTDRDIVVELLKELDKQEKWHDDFDNCINWESVALQSDRNEIPVLKYGDDEYLLIVNGYYIGEEDGETQTWVVFSFEQFPDRYWRVTGRYDSWDSNGDSWSDPDEVEEVFQKAVVRIVYETHP